jgi:AICAR transformylase/IMP cyclohydrolase PurH
MPPALIFTLSTKIRKQQRIRYGQNQNPASTTNLQKRQQQQQTIGTPGIQADTVSYSQNGTALVT